MSPALAQEIITYAYDSDKPLYKATLQAVADARKVRYVFMERQPRTDRHSAMVATLSKPGLEAVTANLVRTWLLKKYKGMLVDFLNGLEIKHEDGVVEDLPASVPDDKLKSAIDTLLGKYPPEVVAVYLNAFNDMNEVDWPNLKKMLAEDKRLQLGG